MEWPNLLIIAGTGRNVGKTTLACQIIEQVSAYTEVVGLKITPHRHQVDTSAILLFERPGLWIYSEQNADQTKDSSKMLAAGAKSVYFVQTTDATLPQAIDFFKTLIPHTTAIVAESAALRNYLEPKLFIMLSTSGLADKNVHQIPFAHLHWTDFQFPSHQISFKNNQWQWTEVS